MKTSAAFERYGPLTILFCMLLAVKSPDALSNAQLWAEDGATFLSQQYGHALPQLFIPYAGYLHLIPRLIAWFASELPLKNTPLIYNAAAIGIDTVAVLYFARRIRFFTDMAIVIAIFALVPTNGEIFGTLTNIQWFTQFALFALAFAPGENGNVRLQSSTSSCIIAAVLALTGPFSILITVMLAAVYLVKIAGITLKRDRISVIDEWIAKSDRKVLFTIAACGIVQLLVLTISKSRAYRGPFDMALAKKILLHGFQVHTFGQAIFTKTLFLIIACTIFYLAIKAAMKQDRAIVVFIGALAFFSISQIAADSHANIHAYLIYTSFDSDRYFTFAKVSFWILVAWILRNHQITCGKNLQFAIFIPLSLVAVSNADRLRRPTLPDLDWKHSVSNFENQPSTSPRIIPINPTGWKVIIPPRQETHQ